MKIHNKYKHILLRNKSNGNQGNSHKGAEKDQSYSTA